MAKSRRVVVRGLGLVSCLGTTVIENWTRLCNNESNLGQLKVEGLVGPCRIGGQVDDSALEQRWKDLMQCHKSTPAAGEVDRRAMSRASIMGMIAAHEALKQSGWIANLSSACLSETSYRAGSYFSTGIEGVAEILSTQEGIRCRGYSGMGAHVLPRTLANMPVAHISRAWRLRGPSMACSTACASGLHSIGEAFRMIKCGEADVVVAGATEASIQPWVLAAFGRIRALSLAGVSRPFDVARDGFVMAEGAGALVLEAWTPPTSQEKLLRPPPIAEILGFGRSADAYSLVQPEPCGEGALRSMKAAFEEAGIHSLDELEHINCHATSTPLGDTIELAAIARMLTEFDAERKRPIHLNSIKGHLGHCLGAAGAVEAVYSVLAAQSGEYVGNRSLERPLGPAEVAQVLSRAETSRQLSVTEVAENLFRAITFDAAKRSRVDCDPGRKRLVLTNAFGFGGTNASLLISNWIQ